MNQELTISTFQVPYQLFEKQNFIELNSTEKVVLFYLIKCYDKNNKEPFYCTTKEICDAIGMVRQTVINAKKVLVEKGFIKVIRKSEPVATNSYKRIFRRIPSYFDLGFLFETK